MDIGIRDIDDMTIVTLDGMLTLGSDSPLEDMFEEQIARKRYNLILDMTKVKYIDSLGIGQLAGGYKSLIEHGGQLCLARINVKIQTLLRLTGLEQQITVFPTVTDALNAM